MRLNKQLAYNVGIISLILGLAVSLFLLASSIARIDQEVKDVLVQHISKSSGQDYRKTRILEVLPASDQKTQSSRATFEGQVKDFFIFL